MERASRLIVLASIALAATAHGWLSQLPGTVSVATAAAFITTFVLARWSLAAAIALIGATAYITPALLTAAFGVVDYHVIVVWLAGVAGPVFAYADRRRWHFPSDWKLPLVAWAVVVAVSWPVVAGREVDFSIIGARSYGLENGIALTSPPLAAAFVVIVALTQLLVLEWVNLLWARLHASEPATIARTIAAPFLVGIAVSCGVGIYQRLVDLDFMNPGIWSNLGRAGGLLNDANTFGMGAALWAPVAIMAGWSRHRIAAGYVLYAVLALGMWATGSRTALMTLAVGTVAVGVAILQRRGLWRPRIGRLAALTAVGLFVLAAATVPREFESGNPLKRAFDRVPRLEAAEIRRFVIDDLWIRFGYGQAAIDMIADYPVAGVGVGAFHVIAPEYIYGRTGRQFAPDNAQNWWRHQVAEFGIVGSLPAVWASGLVLLLLRKDDPAAPAGSITVLRGVVLAVGVVSLLGVPTQHPATAVSFASLVFWLQRLTSGTVAPSLPDMRPFTWAIVATLALIVVAALSSSARDELAPRARALHFGTPYAHGWSRPEGISDFGEFRWAAVDTVAVLSPPHRWLQLTMWAPYRDVDDRGVDATVRIDGRAMVSHHFISPDAETYFIAMPPDRARVTLEIAVSGAVPAQRAIQTATLWRQALPRNAPADRVVQ